MRRCLILVILVFGTLRPQPVRASDATPEVLRRPGRIRDLPIRLSRAVDAEPVPVRLEAPQGQLTFYDVRAVAELEPCGEARLDAVTGQVMQGLDDCEQPELRLRSLDLEFRKLCVAPCEAHLRPGSVMLGVAPGSRDPRSSDPVAVEAGTTVVARYRDRRAARVWAFGAAGVAAATGGALLVGAATLDPETSSHRDLAIAGAISLGTSLSLALIGALMTDDLDLEVVR